jgi:hypothetical protein
MDSIDIYKTFHPSTAEYTFFSSALGTFSTRDYIIGHKVSLIKLKNLRIITCFFSNHNGIKHMK